MQTQRKSSLVTTSLAALLLAALASGQQYKPCRQHTIPNCTTLYWLTTGDVDGDGDQDIVTGNDYAGSQIFINNGRGGFTDETAARITKPQYAATYQVDLADLDGDGDLDLLATNDHNLGTFLYLNNGKGVFANATATNLPPNPHDTTGHALGDFDGDGDIDLVSFASSRGGIDLVFTNNGKGRFSQASTSAIPASMYNFLGVTLDIDCDGDLDLLVGNDFFRGSATVLINNGKGKFTKGVYPAINNYQGPGFPVIADFDGDKRPDIFFSKKRLFRNLGAKGLQDVSATALPAFFNSYGKFAAADVDLDGDLDLVGCSAILLNNGSGSFTNALPAQNISMKASGYEVWSALDLDLDDDPDLILGSQRHTQPKIAVNHHHQIYTKSKPRTGTNHDLYIYRQPGYASNSGLAVPFLAFKLGRVNLAPYGTFGLDPALVFPMQTVPIPQTGELKISLPIPANPNLQGLRLCFQAFIVDSVLSASHLTNFIADRL